MSFISFRSCLFNLCLLLVRWRKLLRGKWELDANIDEILIIWFDTMLMFVWELDVYIDKMLVSFDQMLTLVWHLPLEVPQWYPSQYRTPGCQELPAAELSCLGLRGRLGGRRGRPWNRPARRECRSSRGGSCYWGWWWWWWRWWWWWEAILSALVLSTKPPRPSGM